MLVTCKSDYLPEIDRASLAQDKDLFWTVKTEGLLMTVSEPDKQSLLARKEGEEPEDKVTRAMKNKVTYLDGVFLPGVEKGTQADNQRRLEQQLIAEERYQYFNQDGDLSIDKEFFEEKMQRLFMIDYEENKSLRTFQRPAARCARLNQNKAMPFKLLIFVGVLQFTYHPEFDMEDNYMSQVRYLVRKYKQRTDLALIPHYKKTFAILTKELNEMKARPDNPVTESELIEKEIERLEKSLETEKQLLQRLMEQLYYKWEQVKAIRNQNEMTNTPYKLGVRYYKSNENTEELEFILQNIEPNRVLNDKQLPISAQEQARRQRISQFKVYMEVIINNAVVASTQPSALEWPFFQIRFMQRFEIYMFTKPASIRLRLLKSGFSRKVIDEIEIEIPGEKSNSITSAGLVLKEAYFASGRENIRKKRYEDLMEVKRENQEGLNANKDSVNSKDIEGFEGYISYKTEWPDFGDKMPPDTLDMQYKALDQKKEDELEEKALIQDEVYYDVNDPTRQAVVVERETIRECPVAFANEKSKRQQLLKMRFTEPELAKMQIPLLQEQIERSEELMKYLQDDEGLDYDRELRMQQHDGKVQILEDFITDPNTQRRLLDIQAILQQRRIESQLKHGNQMGGLLTLENVVAEFHFEEAASLLAECIKSLFEKRRKLRVQKRSHLDKKSVTSISEVMISILIIQANNVPIRSPAVETLHSIKQRLSAISNVKEIIDQLYQLKKVSPVAQISLDLYSKNLFIIQQEEKIIKYQKQQQQQQGLVNAEFVEEELEVKVNDKIEYIRIAKDKKLTQTTAEVEGVNPEWNELLDFKIGCPSEKHNFDPKDVTNSRNKIIVTIFDQQGNFRQKANNVNQYDFTIKKHFIGTISIPLLTLFSQDKISGTFRINRPLMLLNYRTLNVDQFLNADTRQEAAQLHNTINIVDPHIPTTVDMTMTLDPAIKFHEPIANQYFPGAESTNLFLYGIKQKYARPAKFWAENLKGESVYLPRFLSPLKPPEMDFGTNAIEKAARYVSLIPFKNDSETFQNVPDVYCTCQEFLDLRAGDFEEHAILLCCFFMYIDLTNKTDIKNYVIMGKGLPEGNTLYVLRRMPNSDLVEIWNPQTGEPFVFQNREVFKNILCFAVSKGYENMNDIQDEACPLKQIFTVFDDKNVYVNIQHSDLPGEMSFDIDNPRQWEPFLTQDQMKNFYPKGMNTIQFDHISFDPIDIDRSRMIQQQLETYLEDSIERYRKENFTEQKGAFVTIFSKQRYAELTTYIRETLLHNLESFKYRIRTSGLAKQANRQPNDNAEEPDQNAQWDYAKSLQSLQKQQQELLKKKDKYLRSKDMYGFPLNFSYLSDGRAWDEIRATGIADIMSDEIEFLCIVKCFPYPHYILSCWVFIAVLYPSQL